MYRLLTTLVCSSLLVACAGNTPKSGAPVQYSKPADINLTVIPVDQSLDDLDKSSRAWQRVNKRLMTGLNDKGFSVFDLSMAVDGDFDKQRDRFDLEDYIEYFSERPKPRMDVVLPTRLYYRLDRENDRLMVGLSTQIIDVTNQRLIAEVEEPGAFAKLAANCRGACVIEKVGELSKPLSKELLQSISRQLHQVLDDRYVAPPSSSKKKPISNPAPGERVDGILIEGESESAVTAPVKSPKPVKKQPAPVTSQPQRIDGILVE